MTCSEKTREVLISGFRVRFLVILLFTRVSFLTSFHHVFLSVLNLPPKKDKVQLKSYLVSGSFMTLHQTVSFLKINLPLTLPKDPISPLLVVDF